MAGSGVVGSLSISRVDRRKSRGSIRAGASGRPFPKATADPLGCRQLVSPREPLDRPKLAIVEQDLQALSHVMSVSDSST